MSALLENLPEIGSLPSSKEARLAKSKRETDWNTLVLHNMREAFIYAKKCCDSELSDDEIFSFCYEALQHARKNFKPNMIRFFAYAKPYIRGLISRSRREKDVIRFPRNGRQPHPFSELENVRAESEETEEMESVEPEFRLMALHEGLDLINPIIVRKLNAQEKMILELHYQSGFNFQKIGDLLGITRSAIQHAHSLALKKIRVELFRQKRLLER